MELKDEHMEILEKAFFDNLMRDNCEYGGIGLDDKRPFGNGGVSTDILEMLNIPIECPHCGRGTDDGYSEEQEKYADALYDNLIPWLQNKYGSKI
jgi:hypothetical protein